MPSIGYQFKSSGSRTVIKDFDDIGTAARKSRQEVEKQPRQPAAARGAGRSPVVKAAEAEAKALATIEKRKLADVARSAREAQALRIRSYKAESRALTLEQRARDKAEEKRKAQTFRGRLRTAVSNARGGMPNGISAAAGIGGRIGGAVIGGVMLAAGAGIAASGAAYHKRAGELRQASELSTSGRSAGEAAVSGRDLLESATRNAISVRGTKTADVLGGMQKYVQMTGDLGGAQSNARTFSIAARASGSSEDSIAATAATAKQKFGIEDPEEMKRALATMLFQGKKGAFEMSDASRYFAEMGAAGQTFGAGIGTGAKGMATLGGLAQIAREAKGTGAEASTATQAMLRQLVAKSDLIKKKTGTSVFADKGKTITNDIKDTLIGTIAGGNGNQELMQKIFGDEGKGAVAKLVSTYNDATRAVGKDATATERRAAGEVAMRKVLDDAIEAGGSWSEVVVDASANTDNASAKMTTAWESLSATLGDQLLVPMNKLADGIGALDPVFSLLGDVIGFVIEMFSDLVNFLEAEGILKKKAGAEKSHTPVADLAATRGEMAELGKKKHRTKGDTKRLMELREKEDRLVTQIADPNSEWSVKKTVEVGGLEKKIKAGLFAAIGQRGAENPDSYVTDVDAVNTNSTLHKKMEDEIKAGNAKALAEAEGANGGGNGGSLGPVKDTRNTVNAPDFRTAGEKAAEANAIRASLGLPKEELKRSDNGDQMLAAARALQATAEALKQLPGQVGSEVR